ncbi:MAG: histidine kinase [Bacteroidales bacterium]|nr:histidine kinase [Bacteroidota bacterium]MBL6950507.1 histidine kinase [Bacteroidales bacterium]
MTSTNIIACIFIFFVLPLEGPVLIDGDPPGKQTDLSSIEDNREKLNQMIELAEQALKKKKSFNVAVEMVKKAFALTKENHMKVPYNLNWLQAKVAFQKGNIYLAEAAMEKTLKQLQHSGEIKAVIKAQNFYAKILYKKGELSKALEIYQKNMKMARDNDMTSVYLESINRQAGIYRYLGDIDESKKFYHSLYAESDLVKDTFWMTEALFRLGSIALTVDSNFRKAAKYQSNCLHIARLARDTSRMAWTMNHLAWNLYLLNEKDSSLALYNKLIKLSIKAKMPEMVTNSLGNIGTIYRDKKEFSMAEKYYQKSIDNALDDRNKDNLRWIHQDISDMYVTMGDYKKAYKNYVQFKLYSDSLNNMKFDRGLAEARMKYDVDQQKKEVELLNMELDKQRYFTYGFASLFILIIAVGLLVIRQYRLNARRKISEMNQRMSEITQANLRQQMNPHFIFNTLNSIQYYMYQHDKVATNNYLTKFSSLIRKILENSQHTSILIKDEMEALQLYLELEKLRFKDKFSYEIDVDEEIDILQNKIPTMLIQPYVENAICHGLVNKEDSGELKIALSLEYDYISCVIEDNGIGREAATEIRKSKEFNHNSLGTRITESRLDLVNALYGTSLKVIYSDLKNDAGEAIGTRVEIHIPIMS